jgi:tetratricopeptide (TPR) repeat protein
MFLERRVYQGSRGAVYPLPFIDRIAESPTPRRWQAIRIENEFLEILVLPEIGGRIHRLRDKTNGYDLIYYQPVIKPALVGLAGPWISGGIEFNWPQHHRPATFLPVDTAIEHHTDGSVTVWCGDHDPLCRMKGMHGICLRPGCAFIELKVRVGNRTPLVQTFLWWANVATRVHEAYQSFFPPDVHCVADHARRSLSAYPLAQRTYYGVRYGQRRRHGIPPGDVPRQFVPPHARRGAQPDPQSAPPTYAPNDLSFYANIPVPTSYMCVGSSQDFFGGYDHHAQAGIVHVANHHIAPGKKQWTWGNHEFGYAWDRNLTDADAAGEFGPYIELMAGVYTDNQPDFSFLQPGEVKSWSQYWYPIQRIGPVHHANLDAAVSLQLDPETFRLGVVVTRAFPNATVRLERAGDPGAAQWRADLAPGKPFVREGPQGATPWAVGKTVLRVLESDGRELIAYQPVPRARRKLPRPASEPPAPRDIASADELYVTGLHLDQYRHATRCPTDYWREALHRDPSDARCNNALGVWRLKRGEFREAEAHFRRAIARLTRRNANPADGEPFYNLGLCLRYEADRLSPASQPPGPALLDAAYAAFYKATWNQAWAGPAYHALAELDCRREDWERAADHIERSCRTVAGNGRAMNLWAMIVARQENCIAAEAFAKINRAADPLDWWACHMLGEPLTCDAQTLLDLALDFARAGCFAEAIQLIEARLAPTGTSAAPPADGPPALSLRMERAPPRLRVRVREDGSSSRGMAGRLDSPPIAGAGPGDPRDLGTAPLLRYYLGWLHARRGNTAAATAAFRLAAAAPADYCFPARLDEIAILETAIAACPDDSLAPYLLGNLLYDRRRHAEAIALWERSVRLNPGFSVAWRNLGLGCFNVLRQPRSARRAYDRACAANPTDARLLYERDQLWNRLGVSPRRRLLELERHPDLVRQRDDLSVELCALYNQTGRHADALALVSSRRFQPWEGGEGGPLGQWVRSHLALGRAALRQAAAADRTPVRGRGSASPGSAATAAARRLRQEAVAHFEAAFDPPNTLGEARHLLANPSDIHYWLGCALAALGETESARRHWRAAATFRGDFQAMRVRSFSEMTYYSALAWERLGDSAEARKLLRGLLDYARRLGRTEAKIDYFATSLPTLLLFDDDLQFRQDTTALFIEAQAALGLGRRARGAALLATVLRRDPNHPLASDLAETLD